MFMFLIDKDNSDRILYIFGGIALFSLIIAVIASLFFVIGRSPRSRLVYNILKLISIGLFLPFCFFFFYLENSVIRSALEMNEIIYLDRIQNEAASKGDVYRDI